MSWRRNIALAIAGLALTATAACGGDAVGEPVETGSIVSVTETFSGCDVNLKPSKGAPYSLKFLYVCENLAPGATYRMSEDGRTSFLLYRSTITTSKLPGSLYKGCVVFTKWVGKSADGKRVEWDGAFGKPDSLKGDTDDSPVCKDYKKNATVEPAKQVWTKFVKHV